MTDIDQTLLDRLEDLESRNAYQDRTLADLSDQIYAHQKQIDRLEALVEALQQKVKGLATGENAPLPDHERPPHY